MSASRTLLRKHKLAAYQRNGDGEMVKRHRVKPGTPHRRELMEERVLDHLHSYHATKGHRWIRQPS